MPARPAEETYGKPTEARERRRRAAVTLVIVLLGLFFAAWFALSYASAGDKAKPAPSTTSTTDACRLAPKDVTVNVYNATARDGLAAKVGEQLTSRGFQVKTVANDPKRRELDGVGEIRFGTKGADAAQLVKAHATGVTEARDQRQRTTVDLVLGDGFTSLTAADEVPAGC